jgi:thiamine kinase-like enzyme
VSLLHGDLSTGNLVAGRDGRLIVVDWERGTRGPVAWDLKKLYRRAEQLVLDVLRELTPAADLEPVEQSG